MRLVVYSCAILTAAVSVKAIGQSAGTPYAGLQTRDIKALSEKEIADLQAGKGMGYALAAELNGYPGPSHVLELSQELSLTKEQADRTRSVFQNMQAKARTLGAQLIEEERRLDQLFAKREATGARMSEVLGRIGRLESELRQTHLEAHVAQAAVLTSSQITTYQKLRGYEHGKGHRQGSHPHSH